jgi:hypothetical protein
MDQEQPRKQDRRRRLTEDDVAQIRAHLQQGKTPATLARLFKVHSKTIRSIRDVRRWRHVAPSTEATPLSEIFKAKRKV